MESPGPLSDAKLVGEILGGATEDFAVLVARYRDVYARFAVRMLGNREDAEEALQSAFVRAFRGLAGCKEPERFGAWMYQIVMNECRTHATRRGRHERRVVHDPVALEQALSRDSGAADDAELREEIQRALDRLPADYREAFLLKHVEELSYEEMAELTGVGISALKMRTKRACDRLRELLQGVRS